MNEKGQEVGFDLVEMRTAEAPGKQKMVLSAWIGTDITGVNRKINSLINYVAVIAKKAEVQTWSEVETHLWREYNENWNTTKHNA